MKLQYVSLTGADDAVDIADLNAIAADFPFVEFAVLLLPEQAGQPRFPTISWIRTFRTDYKGVHKAMHLCGSAFLGFVRNDPDILALMQGFSRIQLNLEFGAVDGQYDPAALLAQIRACPRWQFIIQYTEDKASLLPLLRDIPHHAILFDGSAGQGHAPDFWPAPLPDHFCGYAGGLNPDNIEHHLEKISSVVTDHTTWIDMETGIRTHDRFDLQKVLQILEKAAFYTNS
ncbi:MAG: hypothetical protein CO093_09940 [Alphaproteobacteria bacterium CG_4_9_14_3_um_filter_47_13]|nr:MAG: hypothetical protein CO093_09940 [Alphaproteobacteria bacterium CG_4_9_14_3_um_filter_47_13]